MIVSSNIASSFTRNYFSKLLRSVKSGVMCHLVKDCAAFRATPSLKNKRFSTKSLSAVPLFVYERFVLESRNIGIQVSTYISVAGLMRARNLSNSRRAISFAAKKSRRRVHCIERPRQGTNHCIDCMTNISSFTFLPRTRKKQTKFLIHFKFNLFPEQQYRLNNQNILVTTQ